MSAKGILCLCVCVCVYVCVLCVVHAYKNIVACVGGVCWLKLQARTVCAQTVRGLNFRGFRGSGAHPQIV